MLKTRFVINPTENLKKIKNVSLLYKNFINLGNNQ